VILVSKLEAFICLLNWTKIVCKERVKTVTNKLTGCSLHSGRAAAIVDIPTIYWDYWQRAMFGGPGGVGVGEE
jgi:hypothetical protein